MISLTKWGWVLEAWERCEDGGDDGGKGEVVVVVVVGVYELGGC